MTNATISRNRRRAEYMDALDEVLTTWKLAEAGSADGRARWPAALGALKSAHEAWHGAGGNPNPIVLARWTARPMP